MNADQLMEYVKNLQNNAFTLGLEEGMGLKFFIFFSDFLLYNGL